MIVRTKNFFNVPWPARVERAFNSGGFVAGGFIRHLLKNHGEIKDQYLVEGDIDIFFENQNKFKSFLNESVVFNTTEKLADGRETLVQTTGVQFERPEKLLKVFPLYNTRAAMTKDYLWVDDQFFIHEANNEVGIAHIETRWLASNVYKIMTKRNVPNLSEHSKELFVEWINTTRFIFKEQKRDIQDCLMHKNIITEEMFSRIDLDKLVKEFTSEKLMNSKDFKRTIKSK